MQTRCHSAPRGRNASNSRHRSMLGASTCNPCRMKACTRAGKQRGLASYRRLALEPASLCRGRLQCAALQSHSGWSEGLLPAPAACGCLPYQHRLLEYSETFLRQVVTMLGPCKMNRLAPLGVAQQTGAMKLVGFELASDLQLAASFRWIREWEDATRQANRGPVEVRQQLCVE